MSSEIKYGELVVEAGPSVKFRVLDEQGNEHQQANKSSLTLPEGIYSVDWESITGSGGTLIRVEAGDRPAEVLLFEDGAKMPGHLKTVGNQAAHIVRNATWRDIVSSGDAKQSFIAVVLSPSEPDIPVSPRLFDLVDVRGKQSLPFLNAEPPSSSIDPSTARFYKVPSGAFLLNFRVVTGETLQQTIPALPRRLTLVFLKVTRSDVLIAEDEKFVRKENQTGVDPTRTVIISAGGTEEEARIRERVRLMGILLKDLSTDGTSITSRFADVLDEPKTDPLLKLVAATVVVQRIGASRSPSVDEKWKDSESERSQQREFWLNRALGWLAASPQRNCLSDVISTRWELDRLLEGTSLTHSRRKIDMPPMLACAWRWAVAHSVRDTEAIARTPANIAAARATNDFAPWLAWKASAAKAGPLAPATTDETRLESLVVTVSQMVDELVGMSAERFGSKNLAALSPEVRAIALKMIAPPGKSDAQSPGYSGAANLATEMTVPGRALWLWLDRARKEIDDVLARLKSDQSPKVKSNDAAVAAPGLARPVTAPDDPHKGRFGGQPGKNGFTAAASFHRTNKPDWTRIIVSVEGVAPDGDEVHFHLHDSFRPQVLRKAFRKGRAQVEVMAWGGFTVGIWLPKQAVELELDLATIPDAPEGIRLR